MFARLLVKEDFGRDASDKKHIAKRRRSLAEGSGVDELARVGQELVAMVRSTKQVVAKQLVSNVVANKKVEAMQRELAQQQKRHRVAMSRKKIAKTNIFNYSQRSKEWEYVF